MDSGWFSFLLIATVILFIGATVTTGRMAGAMKSLLLVALALRIVGSTARFQVAEQFYGGHGDAYEYFQTGVFYADRLWQMDFSIFESYARESERWWGTEFIKYASGFVILFIGPSMPGGFLVFSLFSFTGLLLIGLAFQRAYPQADSQRYFSWLWLWPSLWYWPSSIGKEALILLAFGLATYGYVGRRGRINWFYLLPGLALAFAVRPHLAAFLSLAFGIAECFSRKGAWSGSKVLSTIVLGAVALVTVRMALTEFDIEEADPENIQEFMEENTEQSTSGGSRIQPASHNLSGIPMAFVNVLMRPFPWESHNILALLSAAEMSFFWLVVWKRRRTVVHALRQWRSNRLMSFALPLAIMLILGYGMVFGNLGIISRQRAVIFPFLFIPLAAVNGTRNQRAQGYDVLIRPRP